MDMDGTLLTPTGEIPEGFWPVYRTLSKQGWVLVPASGRQLYTLAHQFSQGDNMSIIAENGAIVSHQGKIVSTTPLDAATAQKVIARFRELGRPGGAIVCRPDGAFTDVSEDYFLDASAPYYHRLTIVENLDDYCDDTVVKIAIYSTDNVEDQIAGALAEVIGNSIAMAVSGQHWIDFMDPSINKGKALAALANSLQLGLEDTIAFGDFLNDYQLIETAGTGYAMANAHPKLKAIASEVIGSNADHAVVRTLEKIAAQGGAVSAKDA